MLRDLPDMGTAAGRLVQFALDVGDDVGLDAVELCRGLSFDPRAIPEHVPWAELLAVLGRVQDGSGARFEAAVRARVHDSAPELRTLGTMVADPELVVRVVVAFGAMLLPHLETEIERTGERTLIFRVTVPPPHAISDAFDRVSAVLLELAPTHAGLPLARVRHEQAGRTTTYTIELPVVPPLEPATAEHRARAAALLVDQYTRLRESLREQRAWGRRDLAERANAVAGEWRLTARQAEVLVALLHGRANKEIAAELGCAEGTVRLHVTQILRRAGVASRAELLAKFLQR